MESTKQMAAFQVPKMSTRDGLWYEETRRDSPRSHQLYHNKNLWAKGKTCENKILGKLHEVMQQPTNTGDTQNVSSCGNRKRK